MLLLQCQLFFIHYLHNLTFTHHMNFIHFAFYFRFLRGCPTNFVFCLFVFVLTKLQLHFSIISKDFRNFLTMYLLWNFFSSLNFCILSSMLTPRIQLSLVYHHNNFTVLTNRTFLFNSSQLYSCHMVNISNTLLFHLRRYHLDFRH